MSTTIGKLERSGNWVKTLDSMVGGHWLSVSAIRDLGVMHYDKSYIIFATTINEAFFRLAEFETREEAEAELLKMLPHLTPLVLVGGAVEGPKRAGPLVMPPMPGGLG